jgi:hypothetical protein
MQISLTLLLTSFVSSNAFQLISSRIDVIPRPNINESNLSSLQAVKDGSKDAHLGRELHSVQETNVEFGQQSRRSLFSNSANALMATVAMNALSLSTPITASATVGALPEYLDAKSVLQGITVDVADKSQQADMIAFLEDGFSMKKLHQRKVGSVTETWMSFGPQQFSIPDDWEPAVSSFDKYGGHASVRVRYDSLATDAYYVKGNDAPGDNIAYLQMGVPAYRISQMVKDGGNVYNGYGMVEVVSPSGLPIRGIVGISPDPMMFVALNCQKVKETKKFYEQLGFTEQEYPFCRPNKGLGQFEPPQPKNSVYMAPSKNSMGVLLLQAKKIGKKIKPNPAVRSLNIVYQPSEGTTVDIDSGDSGVSRVTDPGSVPIAFEPIDVFEKAESSSRIAQPLDN